jgi:hypothetical protein
MKDKQMEMTPKHRDGLKKIMEWYWRVGQSKNLISKEDYDLIYELWNNGVSSYGIYLQERLNKIREIYKDNELWT